MEKGENKKLVANLPLVSIITVVFNGEKSIERTINSIINQTYPQVEYIVVDGGSTDGTIDIIEKYQHNINYWKSEPDKGISDAFNKGIAQATGDIVGFVNADDWYNSDTIERIVPYFNRFSVVYGDVQFWKDSEIKHRTYADHSKLKQGMTLAHPAVFVKKSMYEKYGVFNVDYKIAMDYEFIAKLHFNNESFYNVNDILVNMSLGGLSDRNWLKAFKEERKVKSLYLGAIRSNYFFLKQTLLHSFRLVRLRIKFYIK
ncbi:MAG: glycosyltransferase [Cytophagales bacterium]|nr:glycosyltransferase [Cytophagales bacterium]MCA6369598.1 glycosyltransferase [Cytophagales bacterium]MCA6370688.1 glycosyltransferase [Cytophagales bacterium]MCA6383783.1 glycosyltransferase [Cytophagales bacterium]